MDKNNNAEENHNQAEENICFEDDIAEDNNIGEITSLVAVTDDTNLYEEIFDDEEEICYENNNTKKEVYAEVTFTVKDDFKEVFLEIAKIARINSINYFGANSDDILNRLVYCINLNTKKINRKEFICTGKGVDDEKIINYLSNKENIFEKETPVISYFKRISNIPIKLLSVEDLYQGICLNTWSSLGFERANIKIKDIYVKNKLQEEVFCTAEIRVYHKYKEFISFKSLLEQFLGTFANNSKPIEFILERRRREESIAYRKCEVVQQDNTVEIADFSERYIEISKEKEPLSDELILELADLSSVYRVELKATPKPEVEEVLRAVKEVMEIFEAEGVLSEKNRIKEVMRILSLKQQSLLEEYFNDYDYIGDNLFYLRRYQREAIINKLPEERREFYRKLYLDNNNIEENIYLDMLVILDRLTKLIKEEFTEDKETGALTWNFEAEFTGITQKKLEKLFIPIQENSLKGHLNIHKQ